MERIFHIFDADKSGTVSLDEFMGVIRSFAHQSPSEKLHYLFQVYDLNGKNDTEQQFLNSTHMHQN